MNYKIICGDRSVSSHNVFTHNRQTAELLRDLLSWHFKHPFEIHEWDDAKGEYVLFTL